MRNISLEMLQSGLYFDNAFYAEESDGRNHWRWCSEELGKLYIVNAENSKTSKAIDFVLMSPEGREAEFEVWHEHRQLLQGVCGQKYSVQITGKTQKMEKIEIFCHVDKKYIDGRTLCFGIFNVSMRDINE